MADANAGEAYGQYIASQLAEERSRKTSLEARGITVITTSGTLVALLFALTAGLTATKAFRLPASAKLVLLLALAMFVVAAVFGLATNMPLRYEEPTPDGLEKLVAAKYWVASATKGQIRVARSQVNTLRVARAVNDKKVSLLKWAALFELTAVAFLAVAIAFILYEGVPAQKRPSPRPSPTRAYTVQPGDSLWDISEQLLGPKATGRRIDQAWRMIYRDNHSTIGADPNRIFPGQVLRIPISP